VFLGDFSPACKDFPPFFSVPSYLGRGHAVVSICDHIPGHSFDLFPPVCCINLFTITTWLLIDILCHKRRVNSPRTFSRFPSALHFHLDYATFRT